MGKRFVCCVAAWAILLAAGPASAQIPADFTPLVYEAEDYTTPKDAWQADKSTATHWNLWSTDTDAQRKWSGGVVLQSPVVKQDRATPEDGAPPLHTRITGIPRGRYEVEIKLGRALAISRDGKTWERKEDSDRSLGVVEIQDGTFELWVDDRFAHSASPGASYYDCLIFRPVPARVEKPLVAGFAQARIREPLDRGLVAMPAGPGRVYLSWRLLDTDPREVAFNVYRGSPGGPPEQLNKTPIQTTTDFVDETATVGQEYSYSVRTTATDAGPDGRAARPWCVPTTTPKRAIDREARPGRDRPEGRHRRPGRRRPLRLRLEAAAGQHRSGAALVDAQSGHVQTGCLHARTANGSGDKDLGWAIERGIWYSPMAVFDLDGDGRAEVAVKTGEGDPRGPDGRVETGPEWISILDGLTGEELARDDWPSRQIPGEPYNYNLSSRNQMCVAYLDGRTPCLIVERGTYTTIRLVAYEFTRSQGLRKLWTWDSREETGRGRYNSQGAHILHAADIDARRPRRNHRRLGGRRRQRQRPVDHGLRTSRLLLRRRHRPGSSRPGDLLRHRAAAAEQRSVPGGCQDGDGALGTSSRDQSRRHRWHVCRHRRSLSGLRMPRGRLGPRPPLCQELAVQRARENAVRRAAGHDVAAGLLGRRSAAGTAARREDLRFPRRRASAQGRGAMWWRSPTCWAIGGRRSSPASRASCGSTPRRSRPADRRTCLMQDPIYRLDIAVAAMGYYAAPMLSYDLASGPR